MSIFKTPYDTFIGKAFSQPVMQKIRHGIEDAMLASSSILESGHGIYTPSAASEYDHVGFNYQAGLVTYNTPQETTVMPFIFPMIVENPNNVPGKTRNFVVVGDGRHFMKPDGKAAGSSKVVNTMEFTLLRTLLGLNTAWIDRGPLSIASLGQVQNKVFCRWVSNVINSHFELEATERLKVRAIAAFYYQCLFIEQESFTETVVRSMVGATIQTSGVNSQVVVDTLEQVDYIPNIEAFISTVKKVLDNPKLEGLNIGLLSKKIAGTWFGFNGKELAMAALEHPPTFVALVYSSLVANSYKKAGLSKTSEEFRGNGGGSELLRAVTALLG